MIRTNYRHADRPKSTSSGALSIIRSHDCEYTKEAIQTNEDKSAKVSNLGSARSFLL